MTFKHTANGNLVVNFRLAVTDRIKDGDSWRDGDTSYFRISVWWQLAAHVTDSLTKGDRVVIGRLKSRSWETPGASAAAWSRSRPTKSPVAALGHHQAPARQR